MHSVKFILAILFLMILHQQGKPQLVTDKPGPFPLKDAVILVDTTDHPLVLKAVTLLQADLEKLTGKNPPILYRIPENPQPIILAGSADRSAFIRELDKEKKINLKPIRNKWEAYLIKSQPGLFQPGGQVLLVTGADRRGTAYGIFECSRLLGISPWYWWADVPVQQKPGAFLATNFYKSEAPKVKYRGIFINDEAPCLSNWTKEKFGGFNHLFYEKVFELMLRLKANYLWPAMWGNAFYDDDSLNIRAADEYGIVIGTSHHEPLMRAHDEWRRYGKGKWNYDSNAVRLKEFWRQGMLRATNEKIVSIGMRGDGDEPMSRETATALLERIVKDQRDIIRQVTGKRPEATPQLWALYKEVQDYYDKGMRVPDDVTLLLCDDNWGNLRKLPRIGEKPRSGGYGLYYHFDYVGAPRNYKWLNTNSLSRVWEQLHLAWQHQVRNIWIVNVGDIKPMELPISFFLDYAWNPEGTGPGDLEKWTKDWAAAQFGKTVSDAVSPILLRYSQLSSRRKPELLDDKTYSLENHGEFYRVVKEWKDLLDSAEITGRSLPAETNDAYFQLVLHPVKALANLHDMYLHVALNKKAATENDGKANVYAQRVKELYTHDSLITLAYHRMKDGKWNHMMSQTHIGYTYWQQPPVNRMPAVATLPDAVPPLPEKKIFSDIAVARVPDHLSGNIFYQEETAGVSIQAAHFTRAYHTRGIKWTVLPYHGRNGDAITPFPVTGAVQQPGKDGPRLEYDFYTYSKDTFTLHVYCSPTLNYHNLPEGLQFAVSVDNAPPQRISLNKDDVGDKAAGQGSWARWVAENCIIKTSKHVIPEAGKHTLTFWMVSPGVVLQQLVLDFGDLKKTYLGPPETIIKQNKQEHEKK